MPQQGLTRQMSLPARGGAWIETMLMPSLGLASAGRSPHGGRGLKQKIADIVTAKKAVAPRTGGVD